MASSAVMGGGEQQQQAIRRSSGRRKVGKKNKEPRRGMGVEKLERLRLQDLKMEPSFPEVNASSPYLQNPVGIPGFHGLAGSNNHRLLQNHGDSDFVGKKSDDSICGGFVKCYALQCNACHKKKKINGGARPEMYECGDRRFLLGQDFGGKPPQHFGNNGNKVEVVAVHRKGPYCSSWDDGGSGVLTEYDFFPPAKPEEGGGELAMMMKQQQVEVGYSSSMAASNSIDLSLKLYSF